MIGLVLDQTGVQVASDEPSRILSAPSHVTTRSQVLSLYVGILPSEPPRNSKPSSQQNFG
jgi:hypothetical protein